MELSFAPMEGVTYHAYRRIHARLFPGAAEYYSPFIAPDGDGRFKTSGLRDVLPENNEGIRLIPQILCNRAGPFLAAAQQLADLGYEEVNLNAGCPSGTVVGKHKGAGMLADREGFDRCLEEIFSKCPIRVSVKSRLGLNSTGELPALLEIYRRYPLSKLILHARDRLGMYKSKPDWDSFALAMEGLPFPVAYNGNICTPADLQRLTDRFPTLSHVMLGRGAAADPALFRRCCGGAPLTLTELIVFHDELVEAYLSEGIAPPHVAARMKELWFYLLCMFRDSDRQAKAIMKARTLSDYQAAVQMLFSACPLDGSAGFNK